MNQHAAASIADRRQSPSLTVHSPLVEGTGVYQQYLPLACMDIPPSPKTDVFVIICFDIMGIENLMAFYVMRTYRAIDF